MVSSLIDFFEILIFIYYIGALMCVDPVGDSLNVWRWGKIR